MNTESSPNNNPEKAMTRETADELNRIYDRILAAESRITEGYKEMQTLKQELDDIGGVAYDARNDIKSHIRVCDVKEGNNKDMMGRIEKAITQVANNLEKQTEATNGRIRATDGRIDEQNNKWGGYKDWLILTLAGAVLSLGVYVFILVTGAPKP